MFAKTIRRGMCAGALSFASLGAAGCVVDASSSAPPPVVVEPGRLTLRWTVYESVDPNLCVLGRAAAIDIVVSTPGGQSMGEFQAPCTAFATTISTLYAGNYVADALLIDANGRPRTTNIALRPFTIVEQTDLVLDLDFPADSFLDSATRDAVERGRNEAGARPPSDTVQSAPPAVQSQSPSDGAGDSI